MHIAKKIILGAIFVLIGLSISFNTNKDEVRLKPKNQKEFNFVLNEDDLQDLAGIMNETDYSHSKTMKIYNKLRNQMEKQDTLIKKP